VLLVTWLLEARPAVPAGFTVSGPVVNGKRRCSSQTATTKAATTTVATAAIMASAISSTHFRHPLSLELALRSLYHRSDPFCIAQHAADWGRRRRRLWRGGAADSHRTGNCESAAPARGLWLRLHRFAVQPQAGWQRFRNPPGQSERPGQCEVTGNPAAMVVAAGLHAGWPHPPVLTPMGKPAGLTMSYTMLSGRVASGPTPPGT